MTVTTGAETASLASGFVVSTSADPSFITIAPTAGVQGQTFDVAITGQNTHFGATTIAELR